jgi:plasmid stabilization system protein ParE
MKVVFTEDADEDLEEIGDYIAQDSARYARLTVKELRAKARDLTHMPERFAVVGQVAGAVMRRRPYGEYSIFYFVDSGRKAVIIARILHSARDHERILVPED